MPENQLHFQFLENSMGDWIHFLWPTFLFQYPIDEKQFITNIIFFLHKERYLDSVQRMRYGEYYPEEESTDSSHRRAFDRAMKAMSERKQKDQARRKNYNPEYRDKVLTKEKYAGKGFRSEYQLSTIDYMAVENYSRRLNPLSIVSMLSDGRFVDSKASSSNDIFMAYNDYYYYIRPY